jgi:dTDP-4-amino-4,6-dideoxygalactose transaminase
VQLQCFDENERNNYHYIVVVVDETAAGVNSDEIQRMLFAENVITKRYFHPGCHRLEPYRKSDGDRNLPQTDDLAHRVLALPNGTAIQVDQISIICELIRFVTEYAGDITCRLSALQKQQKEALVVV